MIENPPALSFPKPIGAPIAALAPARKPRVMIAVASGDWKLEVHTSESIRMMCASAGCEAVFPRYMFNDGVARSRNNLTAIFLEDKLATHLFFFDSDIVMEPWQFQRLIDSKLPVVGALYPKKQPVLDWVCNYIHGEVPDENGFLKVKHAGTGALLLDRKTIEDFMERHPELIYRGDPGPDTVRCDFFPMRAIDGAYKSEDWAFCDQIIADGGCIWIDTKSQLRHVGKIVYPLQFTLSDDDCVDIVFHRYGLWPDQVRTFFASGGQTPGVLGGHRAKFVRLWPRDFPVTDLHDGGILEGSLEVPIDPDRKLAPVILDIGADYGAFARFAAKRWSACTVMCYEGHPSVFPYLARTVADLAAITATATEMVVGGANAAELPAANILILRVGDAAREILSTLQSAGRFADLDAVALVYENDTEAFFISKLMEATHLLHCWQRLPNGRGIQKFVNRRINFGIRALRS